MGERGTRLTKWLAPFAVLLALACSPSCARTPVDPTTGPLRISIVPAGGPGTARIIEVEKPWYYRVFWQGQLPDDEVGIAEIVDGEPRRFSIYQPDPRQRFSSWPDGLTIPAELFMSKSGSGKYRFKQPDEWLDEDPFAQEPIEGHESAADNPSISLEVHVFSVYRSGKFNQFGQPEIRIDKLLARAQRTLHLRCAQCVAELKEPNESKRVVSVGSLSIPSAVYLPVLFEGQE